MGDAEVRQSQHPECLTCTCGKRAPVQGDSRHGAGSIAWAEHLLAWSAYANRYERFGRSQSPERIAERGGFGFDELAGLLGRQPETWVAWEASHG